MKTIPIIPTETEADFDHWLENYSGHQWGNAISVEKPKDEFALIDYVNIMLMNFWHSISKQDHSFSFTGINFPEICIEEKDDRLVIAWKIQVYKNQAEDSP